MSSNMDHRKPAVAFAVLAVITVAIVGNGLRARAEMLDLWSADDAPAERAEAAAGALTDRSGGEARGEGPLAGVVSSPSTAPGRVDELDGPPGLDEAFRRSVGQGVSRSGAPRGAERAAERGDLHRHPRAARAAVLAADPDRHRGDVDHLPHHSR